ncbi:MAG: hypothetical protein K2Y39_22775 [Candidatus Obscuribacterales bacterium]|nr:hypothetical protein [Candidatus Obscuribacterales bacterium]
MRLEVTPKEPWHIRIKNNGKVVLDKVLEANVAHVVETERPPCGKSEAFLVEGDEEMLLGSAEYGACPDEGEKASA